MWNFHSLKTIRFRRLSYCQFMALSHHSLCSTTFCNSMQSHSAFILLVFWKSNMFLRFSTHNQSWMNYLLQQLMLKWCSYIHNLPPAPLMSSTFQMKSLLSVLELSLRQIHILFCFILLERMRLTGSWGRHGSKSQGVVQKSKDPKTNAWHSVQPDTDTKELTD